MGKIERKIERLVERIKHLEDELTQSLTRKSSTTREINVGDHQIKIAALRKELNELK